MAESGSVASSYEWNEVREITCAWAMLDLPNTAQELEELLEQRSIDLPLYVGYIGGPLELADLHMVPGWPFSFTNFLKLNSVFVDHRVKSASPTIKSDLQPWAPTQILEPRDYVLLVLIVWPCYLDLSTMMQTEYICVLQLQGRNRVFFGFKLIASFLN